MTIRALSVEKEDIGRVIAMNMDPVEASSVEDEEEVVSEAEEVPGVEVCYCFNLPLRPEMIYSSLHPCVTYYKASF